MKVSNDILKSYLECKRKAYLKINGNYAEKAEFELFEDKLHEKYKEKAISKLYYDKVIEAGFKPLLSICYTNSIIVDSVYENEDIIAHFDAVEIMMNKDDSNKTEYIPVIFVRREKLSKQDKIIMAFNIMAISDMQNKEIKQGKFIYGSSYKVYKFNGEIWIKKVKSYINDLRELYNEKKLDFLFLNKHCEVCEFKIQCEIKATGRDDLSLLRGISLKEILKLNQRGIFTVTQYSYTFRPKKQMKKKDYVSTKCYLNLRALAIRENKVYILNRPTLKSSEIRIFLDVEYIPNENFYYLIGVVILDRSTVNQYSFWADTIKDEKVIWLSFLELLLNYTDCDYKIFHYGRFEETFIKRMEEKYDTKDILSIKSFHDKLVNVLAIIYSNIYFPVYSNGLKSIAKYLKFEWPTPKLSGIQCILWRKKWELSNSEKEKDDILQYNLADCYALKEVFNFIFNVVNNNKYNQEIIPVSEIKVETTFKFGKIDFYFKELEQINKCAYFDYQRSKIEMRDGTKTKNKKYEICKKQNNVKKNQKINCYIDLRSPGYCIKCGSNSLRVHQNYRKIVYDMKFNNYGVNLRVIEYLYCRYACRECGAVFLPDEYKRLERYTYNITIWIIYKHIVLRQSFGNIGIELKDIYGLSISRDVICDQKRKAAECYQSTYNSIINKIGNASFMHVDETKVKLKDSDGYVWVFCTAKEVIYKYSDTRKGEIMDDILKDFKGVLVSDFYSAYDSIDCPQQKCLIHLIRDMNDDIFHNQFDNELKEISWNFTLLLKAITITIDRAGLNKNELSIHKEEVENFFNYVLSIRANSPLAVKYIQRFKKYRNKLFTFMDYDCVSWNNNNAERAVKDFATYRKVSDGMLTKDGLERYLTLLSISETCKYQNINFLEFLRSKETNIDTYIQKNK